MSNPINNLYQQGRPELYRQVRTPEPPAEVGQPTQAASSPSPSTPELNAELTSEERAMIQRYFPESSTTSLRLYGPHRNTQTVNPASVGGHLDIRG